MLYESIYCNIHSLFVRVPEDQYDYYDRVLLKDIIYMCEQQSLYQKIDSIRKLYAKQKQI
jgi:hypothetical protein